MADLVEMVFESVPLECISPLLEEITSGSQALLICASERPDAPAYASVADTLNPFVSGDSTTGALTFRFSKARLHRLMIVDPLIQVLAHADGLDVSLSFAEDALIADQELPPMTELHDAALLLRRKFNVRHIYCGYEPASDPETRYFTDEAFGPMR